MSSISPVVGRPGVFSTTNATFGFFSADGKLTYKPGGGVVDGSDSRDSGNTGNTYVLRAGTLMAKNTTTGRYAPFVIGVLQSAVVATGTSVTLTAAQATELVRRVGATGTITLIGPPSAAGTVATFTETYSAVNTTTGVVTCSALNADLIAGSIVAQAGYTTPVTLIDEGNGLYVPTDDTDVDFPRIPMAGAILPSKLPYWPSDTSLITWVKQAMCPDGGNVFVFVDSSI